MHDWMNGEDHLIIPHLELEGGGAIQNAVVAYATYGSLNEDRSNAVLLTHGYTSSHRFAEPTQGGDAAEGSWSALLGPDKAIDTNRYFVVAPNMLGSCYGSSGPASINPVTGRPFGPDFPRFTIRDIVESQRHLLDAMGIGRLLAIVGPSYGGFQAFQWAVDYPERMGGIAAAVTAPWNPDPDTPVEALVSRFAVDPKWNGGHYYPQENLVPRLIEYRAATLRRYRAAAELPEADREAKILAQSESWAKVFDANSLIALRNAREDWDLTDALNRVRARVLYVLSTTDAAYPASIAPRVMGLLENAGVDAQFVELDSIHGHLASGVDWQLWSQELKSFLRDLEQAAG